MSDESPKPVADPQNRTIPHDSGADDGLAPAQHRAVVNLLNCKTIAKAAKKTGVAEWTIRRWLRKDAKFLAAYRAARREVVEAAVGRLQKATAAAVATLERNLNCGRPGDEIRASATILEFAIRGGELADLREQLNEAQQALGLNGEGK